MDRRRAAGALLALAACVACSTAAPTANNQTALELHESPTEGCYYNFQHYGEGDRIMTNEPCLNCTCHNRMLMCYLKVCPFTKAIGQDCTIEKRADQCCPIVTCPDVPVDLLTSTSTSSPAEYGGTGLGKVDKYGCSINGKYFPEGSKVPPTPNKPCEHCYCIRNMTTCVMQECTLHVDGCTPIYHKDVCCPVRYSCDHQEDEMLLLDDMTTTVRPTPGFLLTTTTMAAVTQMSQDCVHDDQIFADGALIKTEKACEHCYCMKGDIVCVVQECGTPMENEGKNCSSLPPRQGQCCPDTYICEGDELISDVIAGTTYEDLTTLSPPRRVEGSGYRNEPDEPYTEMPAFEGSGEEQATTLDTSDMFTQQKQTPEIIDEVFAATEEPFKPSISTIEPDKGQNTVPDDFEESTNPYLAGKTTISQDSIAVTQSSTIESVKDSDTSDVKITTSEYYHPTEPDSAISIEEELIITTETAQKTDIGSTQITEGEPEVIKETASSISIQEVTTRHAFIEASSSEASTLYDQEGPVQTADISKLDEIPVTKVIHETTEIPKDVSEYETNTRPEQVVSVTSYEDDVVNITTSTTSKYEQFETTSINPVENEIDEDVLPPGRIPGEGDCLLNGITYKNNTSVPNINNCHSSCKCFSSIVKCDPIICSPPPEHMDNMNDCQPIYDTPDACCPTYVCHSRETIPPESHSQMSGTESPKPSSEKPEGECNGEQCQAHETSPELCDSGDCQIQEQVKKCKNGLCVEQSRPSSDKSPPLKYPETCVGDNCLSSEENCVDGKCQQPTISGDICNNENGCQTSEAVPCDGYDCGSNINIPKDDKSEISKPSCDKSSDCDSTVTEENTLQSECTEESCKQNEQSKNEHLYPSECSGPDCKAPEEGLHELIHGTSETPIKDEVSKESTTEKMDEDFSKPPQQEMSFPEQETQDEVKATEKQETSEISTEKSNDVTINELYEHKTGTQQPYTEPTKSHITKLENTVTETFNELEPEDHTIIPQASTTKSEEQVTQSFEHITMEISTELPLTHKEHSTIVPVEIESTTQERFTEPIKTLVTSTEISDIELPHVNVNKEDATNTGIDEEFTQKYVIPTETPNLQTSKIPEIGISEEYTKRQEIYTEVPEIATTYLVETNQQDDKITELHSDIGITESSISISSDTSTEKKEDHTRKEDDGKIVVNESTDIQSPISTDKLIPVEQTSESYGSKVEEPVTNKMYSDTQTEEILTENPNVYTEKQTFETPSHDLFVTEKDFPSITTQETLSENGDVENTVSSLEDQKKYTQPPEIHETVQSTKESYTTPVQTQEYVTSSIMLETHATPPLITEEKPETETQGSLTTERVAHPTDSSEESLTTSVSQDFTMKQSSTQGPEISGTTLQEITNADETKISPELDVDERSTKMPEQTLQDDTTQKESVVTTGFENTISPYITTTEEHITSKPISGEPIFETTISSMISDKDQETGTRQEDELATVYSEGTLAPEIIVTMYDKVTPSFGESEKTLATSDVESETATTESFIEPDVEKDNTSNKTPSSSKPAEDINEEATESLVTVSEKDVDDMTSAAPHIQITEGEKIVTVSTVDKKADETLISNKTDSSKTEIQTSKEKETTPLTENVTEQIDSDIRVDVDKETFTPTVYPDLRETDAPETQDEKTEIVSELQTDMPTTSAHFIKETESPMSLVTQSEEHTISPHPIKPEDDSSQIVSDKTTQTSLVNEPLEESMQSHGSDEIESHNTPIESPEISVSEKEYGSDTPSPIYPEKESELESTSTIAAIEYTTGKVEDMHKESITSSPIIEGDKPNIVTEAAEQQAPSTKYEEDTTFVQIPTKSDSEHSLDVLQESSTTKPLIETSEDKQEAITFDQESSTKSTEQPQRIGQETSTEKKITEAVKEDHTNAYDGDEHEHTMSPELLTTKYVETSNNESDKETDEYKPDKQEMSTSAYEEHITTENLLNTVQPDIEYHSTTVVEKEKLTTIAQMLETKKDSTTSSYEGSVPDISTSGIITTETSIHEEDHRRTLSPAIEFTTEKQEIPVIEHTPGPPEVTKTESTEDDTSIHKISTNTPVEENITLTPVTEQHKPEYVTSLSQSEDESILQTGTMASYGNEDVSVATENIDKHITEVQYTIEKPLHTEQDLQTELPTKDVIVKDEVTDRTTVQEDLAQIPVEPVPSQEIVPHELETEVTPSETETESSATLETGTVVPHKTETDTYVPKETETSDPTETETLVPHKTETDTSVPKETETSVPTETGTVVPHKTETDTSVPKESETYVPTESETLVAHKTETDTSVPKETETSIPTETGTSLPIEAETSVLKETETSTPKETETSVPKETETSIPILTETSTPKVTETSVPKETETSVPDETETSIPEETETSVPEKTETSVSEETVSSIPKGTETSILKETETSVPEVTDSSIPKGTETTVPKETETSIPGETASSDPGDTETSVAGEIETFIPKATETSVPKETETSVPEVTETSILKETETSVIKVTETSAPEETVTSIPKETETSVPKETETSVPKETETSIIKGTEASVPTETETSIPKGTETSVPEEIETSVPKETEISDPKETETSVPLNTATEITSPIETETEMLLQKETESSVPIKIGTESSVPKETQGTVPVKTDITVPVQTETETSVQKETYGLSPEQTESSVPKVTEDLKEETETTQNYIKPESSTDQLKDEKSPEELLTTLEPIYSSSETTPYLVELQEHTNIIDEDISSVVPIDTYTTKASEIYQTERGDQPLEVKPVQSTQKDVYKVQTEPTFIEKDEELTSLPQEQPGDYQTSTSAHEETPHKTEEVTEEVTSVSSEPTLLDTSPEENIPTILTEEQGSTIRPVSIPSEHDKLTTLDSTGTEKTPEQHAAHETIAPEDELLPTITKATTTIASMETTTQLPPLQDKITKPEEKPVESYPPTAGPEMSKPGVSEVQPTEELPSPDFPASGSSGYGQEPDYVEEDQAFGPGTCRYGGKVYVSAQQIPRDDPCDFCFCFRSDIICLQQSCPPPIQGCHEEPIQGFCCPRYECPVSMATTLNVTTTTTTTTTTLPPHFLPHAYKGAAQRRGCQIKGHTYKVGDVVRASSGPCLHCTCGGDGQMKCDPKACTPEPMLRQMIAAAVSAKRRR